MSSLGFNFAGPAIFRATTENSSTQVEMFLNGAAGRGLTVTRAPAVRQEESDQPGLAYPMPDTPPFLVSPNAPMDMATIQIFIAAKQRGTSIASASIMKGILIVNETNEVSLVFISGEPQGEGGYPFEIENPGAFGTGVWKFVIDIVEQKFRIRVQDTAGSGIIDWKAAVQIGL